ncbi:hypothetical protein PVAND_005571 [Polypedilum vanderplanki]|uniref:VWFC domain-containing protein n=1 Tax=Polypedilum vanderplanki TaxID=319348 RepID=A0A9J6C0X0_POLVA|nr:hypothetical protein PVAND_005571 [Polypedilum vanderplanki]
MKIVLLIFFGLNFIHLIWSEKCPIIPKHYEELNCIPKIFDENNCPLSFDCSSFEQRDKNRCHYNGSIFDVHKELHNSDIEESCTINCVCHKYEDDEEDFAKFNCAHIDCPEFLDDELPENCIRQYKKGSCCSQSTVCGEDIKKLAKCQFNGDTYYDGQQFEAENGCYSCLCGKGFENKPVEENKHCKKINCLIDLRYSTKFYDGCVPVYFKKEDCCPITFKCPRPETKIIRNHNNQTRSNDASLKCIFGDLKMSIGDSLSPEYENDCTVCTCKVPPHPTCVNTC